MRYILLFLLLFILSCQSKSTKRHIPLITEGYIEPKDSLPEIWIEYSTKDSIPKSLIKKLDSLGEENFKIVNPKDNFQATDLVINKNLPWRQLRFLGKSGKFWIMTYKHGGVGLHYHFIVCEIVNNDIKMFRTGVSTSNLETISQIKEALSNQKIDFKDLELKTVIDKV